MTSSYSLSSLRMTATFELGGSYIIFRYVDVYSLAIVTVDTVITVKGFFDWALGERLPLA